MNDFKNRSVLIADNGLFVELALRLARDFGHVAYWMPWKNAYPKAAPATVGVGLAPNVERVLHFWDHVPEADLIVFPDVYDSDAQRVCREMGKPVWGAGAAESLELDRWGTRRLQKELGIAAPGTKFIVGIDKLADYLKDTEDKWVKISCFRGDQETFHHESWHATSVWLDYFKNRVGALADRYEFMVENNVEGVEVGYDGWTVHGSFPDSAYFGYEVKDKGYVGRFTKYKDHPRPIRDLNDALAPLFREAQAASFCSLEFRLGGDGVPYLIDPCFSDDTEVLTDKGWRLFEALDGTETVATLDVKTKEIVYQKPTDYLRQRYEGEMVLLTTPKKVIECLVTPNHGVWRTDRNGDKLSVERADSLTDKGFVPRSGRWAGVRQEEFVLPAYRHSWVSGKGRGVRKEKDCPPLHIPMDAWLAFLGIYLAEGSLHGKWGLNVSQRKHVEAVGAILKGLPVSCTRSTGGFVLHSVQLAAHMRQFGLCDAKFVPDYVKHLCPKQIRTFLDAYLLGDGSVHKNGGQKVYATTSKRMADDLQELIFKTGSVARVVTRHSAGTEMASPRGEVYVRKHDNHVVYERPQWKDCWFETGKRSGQYLKRVPYSGFVYDVTVPNHTVYVRRNGKPFWSSNCLRCGSPPIEGTMEGYDNLAEILWEGAHGRVAEPRPLGKFVAMAMIHCQFALTNWVPIDVKEEDRRWVKLRNAAVVGGKLYHVPMGEMPEIGAVVAVADSLDEARSLVKERAERVGGYNLEIHTEALDSAEEEIERGREFGVEFGD